MAAFRGMHMSLAKHSFRKCDMKSVTDGRTDGRTDRRTTDKVIPMCRFASHATQKSTFSFVPSHIAQDKISFSLSRSKTVHTFVY